MVEERFESLNIADTTLRDHPEIKPKQEKISPEQVDEYCDQLAGLAVEKAHLGHLLYQETGVPKSKRENMGRKKEFSLEEELRAIEEGRIDQVVREKPEEPASELRNRLQVVEAQLKTLVAYPQVAEQYRKDFAAKIRVIKNVREIEKLRQWAEGLRQANDELVLKREKTGLSKPDEGILSRNKKRIAAAEKRVGTLEEEPGVVVEERRRELLGYRRQLREQKIVETPTVRERLREIKTALRCHLPVFLWGHTGVGKTEYLILASKQIFGKEPAVLPGGEEVNQYDVFGSKGFDETGTFLELGPLPTAWEEKTMFLGDEVDLMPHAVAGELHHFLTREPGDKIRVPGSAKIFKVPESNEYGLGFTGNLRSEKYRQRQELDPAFLRRLWKREIKYLPPHESFDILLASLIDRRGALRVGRRQGFEELKHLCEAAKFVQDVFTGEKTDFLGEGAEASRGIGASLEKATLSIGDLLSIVKAWKRDDFTHSLEDFILSEFIQSQTVRKDQLNLVKIFCLHGFFKNKKAKDFGISGLTEEKLLAYRAESV